jgi:hypothetical protein
MTCDRSVVFSGYSGFPTYKTDRHNIIEILLAVLLNTINRPPIVLTIELNEEPVWQSFH